MPELQYNMDWVTVPHGEALQITPLQAVTALTQKLATFNVNRAQKFIHSVNVKHIFNAK